MQKIEATVDYIVFRETTKGWKIPKRTISNHELVFVLEGQGQITINGKSFEVSKNDVVYFYPNQEHSLTVQKAPYMKFIGVHFTFTDGTSKLPITDVIHFENLAKLRNELFELIRVWEQKRYLYSWKQDLLINQILLNFFEKLHYHGSPSCSHKIANLIEYIHQNPYKLFRIEELCVISGMKKSYLIKNFKEITGKSPIQYTLLLKLDYSKNLLVNTEDQIKTIAEKCGFSDEFYYSRLFKQNFGLSPCQFRAKDLFGGSEGCP